MFGFKFDKEEMKKDAKDLWGHLSDGRYWEELRAVREISHEVHINAWYGILQKTKRVWVWSGKYWVPREELVPFTFWDKCKASLIYYIDFIHCFLHYHLEEKRSTLPRMPQ